MSSSTSPEAYEAAVNAAWPGLPPGIDWDEAQRRIRAAVDAVVPIHLGRAVIFWTHAVSAVLSSGNGCTTTIRWSTWSGTGGVQLWIPAVYCSAFCGRTATSSRGSGRG